MSTTYKCIPVSRNIAVGKKGTVNDTSNHIEDIINKMAVQGWLYDNVITTSTLVPPGCLSSLLGGKGHSIPSNILVFKKVVVV